MKTLYGKRNSIAAVILAGGKACRLGGMTKGDIRTDEGVSIVERIIRELRKADIGDIAISANDAGPYQQYGLKIIADSRTGLGPIGGIESGIAYFAGQSDAVMFVPSDTPNLTAKEFSALKKAFLETKAPVVFAQTTGFFSQPLCAVVHIGLRETISSAIDGGQRKIQNVWRQCDATELFFSDEKAFFNINDPAQLNQWRKDRNMKIQIGVEESIAKPFREFLAMEKIELDIVTGQKADVDVIPCDDRKECNFKTIYAGGWIGCETARSLAGTLNISIGQMGKLLDHLDVKIRKCSLGCF